MWEDSTVPVIVLPFNLCVNSVCDCVSAHGSPIHESQDVLLDEED